MMTSSRLRDNVGGSFASRRGHASQLSISDPSHHVTEAIGTLYGDEDDETTNEPNRPLSFLPSTHPEQLHKKVETGSLKDDRRRMTLLRTTSDQTNMSAPNSGASGIKKSNTLSTRTATQQGPQHENGPKSPISPTLSLRDSLREVQSEGSQFPMTNIEDPSDIAQELSNLQALRRMSMDVGNTSDPDLLPFAGMSLSTMPAIAPSGGDDESDPSRLLWVPAGVHPELAPTEFKTFLEGRVRAIKRRSGESDGMLSPDGLERGNSGGLKRKKSMLSRQIDNSGGRAAKEYVDGAERLDNKRSSEQSNTELSLDELVKDPTKAVQKLTQESHPASAEGNGEDLPILPMTVPGMGLRRSTRTTYRKGGSLRSGERHSLSKRTSGRQGQQEAESPPDVPTNPLVDAPPGHTLSRVQSEPISADSISRPSRSVRRQQKFSDHGAYSSLTGGETTAEDESASGPRFGSEQLPMRPASSAPSEHRSTVPSILETPAAEEEATQHMSRPYPQRSSSSTKVETASQQASSEEPHARPDTRPSINRTPYSSSPSLPNSQQSQMQTRHQQQQQQQYQQSSANNTLNDMASHPSPLPGGGATRTDSLTFIPTLATEDRRGDRKSKKDKDDEGVSGSSSKSTGWSKWLKGSSEKEEKKRREEEKKKTKSFVEKAQDNVRLDVLQNSIESAVSKGRESLLLDRDNVDSRLAEERKKESSRKSDPPKREKEGGLFSGLFGGSKKKADRESTSKKGHYLRVSEDPPYRPLRPDVDYHWTRFPLLEERAIYRMAHIKLANPRRSLASQVLLSNFMYNYLAIVQAMHPQIQVPQSPQQRRLEEERRRKEEEEQYLAQQQMLQAQQDSESGGMDQYNYEYHRGANQYGDNSMHEGVDYIDDAQIYEYDHGGGGDDMLGDDYGDHQGYGDHDGKDYYHHDQYGHGHDYDHDHHGGGGGHHGSRRDGGVQGGGHDMW